MRRRCWMLPSLSIALLSSRAVSIYVCCFLLVLYTFMACSVGYLFLKNLSSPPSLHSQVEAQLQSRHTHLRVVLRMTQYECISGNVSYLSLKKSSKSTEPPVLGGSGNIFTCVLCFDMTATAHLEAQWDFILAGYSIVVPVMFSLSLSYVCWFFFLLLVKFFVQKFFIATRMRPSIIKRALWHGWGLLTK